MANYTYVKKDFSFFTHFICHDYVSDFIFLHLFLELLYYSALNDSMFNIRKYKNTLSSLQVKVASFIGQKCS
jgi:hypothetical protein